MKVKSEREVTQSYPTLSDPMDCSLPGSSVHRIFQATVLEWDAIAFSDTSTLLQLKKKNKTLGIFLVIQWLGILLPVQGDASSIPGLQMATFSMCPPVAESRERSKLESLFL